MWEEMAGGFLKAEQAAPDVYKRQVYLYERKVTERERTSLLNLSG